MRNLPFSLKAAVFVVAATFLGYCIYWLVQDIIWGYNFTFVLSTIEQISRMNSMGAAELVAISVQEYSSVVSGFVLMFSGTFAFQSAIYYLKSNPKYLQALRRALILLAVFSLLLLPSSLHHFLGAAYGWTMVDARVGLSYLIQALLIVPPLLILSQKIRHSQNPAAIKKWVFIAAPAYVFALYFKYLLLWWDTLLPMGPKEATLATAVGGVNSTITLLVAGLITAVTCYSLSLGKRYGMRLAGVALILVGCFFAMFSLVGVFVPVYAWFWYLTDFWMLSLVVAGVICLRLFWK